MCDLTALLNLVVNLLFSLNGFPLNCRTGNRLSKGKILKMRRVKQFSCSLNYIRIHSVQKRNRPSHPLQHTHRNVLQSLMGFHNPDDIMVLESGRHIQVMKNKCICSESIWQPCSAPGLTYPSSRCFTDP